MERGGDPGGWDGEARGVVCSATRLLLGLVKCFDLLGRRAVMAWAILKPLGEAVRLSSVLWEEIAEGGQQAERCGAAPALRGGRRSVAGLLRHEGQPGRARVGTPN